jgi:hypothetical protein
VPSPPARKDQAEQWADHGSQRVRPAEIRRGHGLGQQSGLGGTEQRPADTLERNHDRHGEEEPWTGQRDGGEQSDRHGSGRVRGDHRQAAFEPVADDPARNRHEQAGKEESDADDGQGRR